MPTIGYNPLEAPHVDVRGLPLKRYTSTASLFDHQVNDATPFGQSPLLRQNQFMTGNDNNAELRYAAGPKTRQKWRYGYLCPTPEIRTLCKGDAVENGI